MERERERENEKKSKNKKERIRPFKIVMWKFRKLFTFYLPRSGTGSFNLSNLTSVSCWYKSATWATHRNVRRPVLKCDVKSGSSSDSSLHHRSCDECFRVLHFSHTCKFSWNIPKWFTFDASHIQKVYSWYFWYCS